MAQYRAGTVNVTNGSATVTVSGATAGAESVSVGDAFKLDLDGDAIYDIASRTPASGASITSLTLSVPYAGATVNGSGYQITSDFTPSRSYPELSQGDADAADWITRALRAIDQDVAALVAAILSRTGGNMTGGMNEALSTVASASSPDIFATSVGNIVNYTGTTTCTGFAAAPQAGARRLLVCAAAAPFTAGANLLIDGITSGQTYTATAGERIEVLAVTTTQFRVRSPSRVGAGGLRVQGRVWTETVSVAYASTVAVNTALSNAFEVGTLTGNVATLTLSNPLAGHTIAIRFKQDATGSRTVASPAGAKITGSIDSTANVASYLTLTYSAADSRWEGNWSSVPA